jgi:hypothetical protein
MQNIIPRIIIGIFILVAIYGIVNSIILSSKKKVYTVAQIYKKSGAGKRGRTYYFKYRINNKEFNGDTEGIYKYMTNDSGYIFVEVLANDLKEYHVIEFKQVPVCLTLDEVPEKGWSSLPERFGCN